MAKKWYYRIAGEERGPVTPSAIRELAKSGEITPDTPIREESKKRWTRAKRLKGLFDSISDEPAARKARPTSDEGISPSKETSPKSVRSGLWKYLLYAVPVLLAVAAASWMYLSRQAAQSAKIAAANRQIEAAIADADKWLSDGDLAELDAVVANLNRGYSNTDATEGKSEVERHLHLVEQRRLQLNADETLAVAVKAIENQDVAAAEKGLEEYIADEHATGPDDAKQLLAALRVASSDQTAGETIVELTDEELKSLSERSEIPNRFNPERDIVKSIYVATLLNHVPQELKRRADEAERQRIALAKQEAERQRIAQKEREEEQRQLEEKRRKEERRRAKKQHEEEQRALANKLELKRLRNEGAEISIGDPASSLAATTARTEAATRVLELRRLIIEQAKGEQLGRILQDETNRLKQDMSQAEFEAKMARLELKSLQIAKGIDAPSAYFTAIQQDTAELIAEVALEHDEIRKMNKEQFAARLDALHEAAVNRLSRPEQYWKNVKLEADLMKLEIQWFEGSFTEHPKMLRERFNSTHAQTEVNRKEFTDSAADPPRLQEYFDRRNAEISKKKTDEQFKADAETLEERRRMLVIEQATKQLED